MHQILRFAVMAFMTAVIGLGSAGAETIDLTEKTQIDDAIDMNDAIDAISSKVMQCIEKNNGEPQGCICLDECSCKFADEYLLAKNTYLALIRKYPNWDNQIIYFRKPADPAGYNINFAAVKKQFGGSCQK